MTSSFAPPGKQYSFMVELSSAVNTTSSLLFQQVNACPGTVYTCSFQHAWQLNSGTLDYFGIFVDFDAVQPVFGWMTTWPLSSHWYTETFNITAGQDGYNGNDIFMPVYYTPEPTAAYDFIGYLADFQCTVLSTSSSSTTTTVPSAASSASLSTTAASTTTSATPSSTCASNPLTNGDFSTGQLAPWSDPYGGRTNQNAGGITTTFVPSGKTYAWAANLNSAQPEYSGQLQQYLNTCAGMTYSCSYQHAWTMNSGQSSYFQFMMQINSAQPQIGYINALWPTAGQWYTETFTFTAQGGGSDYTFVQYYTGEGTAATYDFTGYFGGLQCTIVSPSTSAPASTTTPTMTPSGNTMTSVATTTSSTTTTPSVTATSATCLATPVINGNFASGSISPWVQHKYDGYPALDNSNPPGQQAYDWAPAINSRCKNCSSASLSQTLNTCVGSTYVCTFQFAWEASNGYGVASEVGIQISRNTDVLLSSSMTKYPEEYTYYQDTVTFVAKGNDQVTWQFLELTPTSSYYYWVGFLGNFQCAIQTVGTPTTTVSATQPTSTTCSASPVVNGDFSNGQLAPWTYPNTGPGGGISSFAPPGKSHSWAGELSSTNNISRLSIRSAMNTCTGMTYYCSFQHAYTAISGSPEWLYLYLRVDGGSNIPVNGFMTSWPTTGQWYTESFAFTAQNGGDFVDFNWETYNPTGAYDFTGYIANFQCTTSHAN